MPEEPWVVLVAAGEDPRSDAVIRALAAFRGTTRVEAAMEARRSRGILVEGSSRADAEALAETLRSLKAGAMAAPAASVVPLPGVVPLVGAGFAPGGLAVKVRGGGERLVPWARVRLVAVAYWSEVVVERKKAEGPTPAQSAMSAGFTAVTGIPVGRVPFGPGRRQPKEETVRKTEFRLLLDLCLRDPPERLRLDPEFFDWSGLGPRMAHAALPNLKAFAEEVLRHASAAATGPGTDLLLDGGRLASLGHEGPADFEREERWQLSVVPA